MNLTKEELRALFLQKRAQLSSDRTREAQKKLLEKLSPLFVTNTPILSYASFQNELSTDLLNLHLASLKSLVLPRVQNNYLEFFLVTSPAQQLKKNRWGIPEPLPEKCTQISLKEISLALIPGLAFDQKNHRLGYGKGYYDRLLSKEKIATIGVAFNEQLTQILLPSEPHDIPVSSTLFV